MITRTVPGDCIFFLIDIVNIIYFQNNTFEWSNGWYPTYTNWGSINGGDREYLGCVAMGNGPNGGWHEVDCTTSLMAICKTTDGK